MRPLKIVISAFGPYSDVQTIDFSLLNEKGIFLITGDTGAGKTTIFDAISFALYGEASGGTERRLTKSFRSDYSKKSTLTYVEFTFSHKNLTYVVRRNPEYERLKIRGDGLTIEPAAAYLNVLETKESFDTIEAVNKKINEVLNLTKSQFNQTVMIAQGDFMKILNAKSEERKKLFQRIFNTGDFAVLQAKLKEMNSSLDLKLKNVNNDIKVALSKIRVSDGFNSEIYKYIDSEYNLDKLLPLFSELLTFEEEKKKTLELVYNSNQDIILNLTKQIIDGKNINDNLSRYQKLIEEIKILKEKEHEILKLKEEYLLLKNAINLKEYEIKYENYAKEVNNLNISISSDKEELKVAQNKLPIVSLKKEKITEEFSNIKNLNYLLSEYSLALNSKKEFDELNNKIINLKEKLSLALIDSQNKDKLYEKKKNIFYASQAGILASSLKDNTPCPVCGSLTHPNLAKLSIDSISKNDLDTALNDVRKSNDYLNKLSLELNGYQTKASTLEQNITSSGFDIKTPNSEIEKQIKSINDKINKINLDYRDIQNEYTTMLNLIDSKNASIKDNMEKYQLAIKEEKLAKDSFYTKLYDFGFIDINHYHQVKENINKYDELEKTINDYDSTLSSKEALLEEYKEKTKDTTFVDIESLEKQKNLIKTNCDIVSKEKDLISLDLSINKNTYLDLKNNKVVREQIVNKYSIVNDVYRSVSGQLSQKVKISFETYIQQYYFKQVIVYANKRLVPLTDGMFALRCKPQAKNMQSQVGLDLDVLDRNTGVWRDVSTLSGGESFLASLALALGLSDVVQSMSGGVRIESMFIDEGFGTLDDNTLNEAIKVISKLADGKRTVAIISHVSKLKERIDNKIIVNKTPFGSSINIEVL